MKKTIGIVVSIAMLTSCGLVASPDIVMTKEGMHGMQQFTTAAISEAKTPDGQMSGGMIRDMYETQERGYTRRYEALARHSEPTMMQKAKMLWKQLLGPAPAAPIPGQATIPGRQ